MKSFHPPSESSPTAHNRHAVPDPIKDAMDAHQSVEKLNSALHKSELETKRARDYAEAILRTSPVPLLVLEKDLRVKTANEAFYEVFKVSPGDTEGRAVYELGNRQWNIPRLRELLENILPYRTSFRGFEVTHDFVGLGRCTMLLSARRMETEIDSAERIVLVIEDITQRKQAELALATEKQVLELTARGAPLSEVLDTLMRETEAQSADGMLFSILLLDGSGKKLLHGAAPSLPEEFNQAVNGLEIGPGVGSCGAAAFERQAITVEDVAQHPNWAPYKHVAAAHGLTSCSSRPIFSSQHEVLGTVAMYYRRPHLPSAQDLELSERASRLAAIVIERKRAEEALRASEARYRTLFDSMDEGFCIIEFLDGPEGPLSDYIHVEANAAYARHAGIPNVVGQKLRSMVGAEAEGWLTLYRGVLTTGKPIHFERELVATGRHLELSAFRIEPERRRQVAVLFQDVTARKVAEKQLSDELQATQQLQRVSTELIHEGNVEAIYGNILDAAVEVMHSDFASMQVYHPERGELRLLGSRGYTPETTKFWEWVRPTSACTCGIALTTKERCIVPDVQNSVLMAGSADQKTALEAGIHALQTTPLISRSGKLLGMISTHWRTPHEPSQRELTVFDVLARQAADVLERRQADEAIRRSEERLLLAMERGGVGIFERNIQTNTVYWSPSLEALYGLPPGGSEGTHESWIKRLHPEDRAAATAANERAVQTCGEFNHEFRVVWEDGSIHWLAARAHVTSDAEGRPLHMIGVNTNITERRQAEDALRAAKEEAEAASRAKDNFLAQLSHELRTPLTPVLMSASLLQDDDTLSAEAREQLAMMVRNVTLEARLIDDLLDLTRISRGKLALRAEPCDLHSLLGNVVEIVREDAREKRIDLTLDLAAHRNHLTGDPARLQQVFWNLLRNAVKFTPAGGHIRLASHDGPSGDDGPGTGRFCVSVNDDGIGFDPSAAASLFEPFEQDTSHNFGGLGLGLAIAHAIVDLHGGEIHAESPGRGKGATFIVELPGATTPPATETHIGHPAPADTTHESPLRLLLVEDHEATLAVLSRLLRKAGHHVTTADTVAAARAAAASQHFDAVISDLGLPDGTGIELMQHLRAAHGLTGIALSGYGMEEDLRRSREAGFVTHLVKPIDVSDLHRALRVIAVSR